MIPFNFCFDSNSKNLFLPSLFLHNIAFLGIIPGSVKVVNRRKKQLASKVQAKRMGISLDIYLQI
jgi:hypothetical protein